jgi:Squalene-hopene cyclase C-terminal domain/Prenyltransferase and squalene oxidase repeat
MSADLIASVGMLAMFIWVCRFLLPRALRDRDPLGVWAAIVTGLLMLFGWLLVGIAVRALAGFSPAQVQPLRDPAGRAVAYLSEEVPRWRRGHACYSCHNNGDAVRALLAASKRGHQVQPAIADSLDWLGNPERWKTNAGGEGGGDDKGLARIQFAAATAAASADTRVPAGALPRAASLIAADQQKDGSWRLDASDSIGSPATYGTALATTLARRTLVRSGSDAYRDGIARAASWLNALKVENTPDAVAILLAAADAPGISPDSHDRALEFLLKTQGRDGGWGPYATSAAENFDTAIAVLALTTINDARHGGQPGTAIRTAVERGREYLRRQQLPDGSWMETTRPARQQSYAQRISTTAWALLALLDEVGLSAGRGANGERNREALRLRPSIGALELVDLERSPNPVTGNVFENR